MSMTRKVTLIIALFAFSFLLHGCETIEFPTTKAPWNQETSEASENQTLDSHAQEPEVKVAILLPLSGKQAALGQSMLQAAQMALFDAPYKNLSLVPRDTKGTSDGARSAAQSALDDGVQIILGPLFAGSVRAVKPIAQQRGVNIIAFSTDQTLADRSTFLVGFMPDAQAKHIANYALHKNYKKFALIAPRDKYSDIVVSAFQAALDEAGRGEIVQVVRFVPGNPNMINQVQEIKNDGSIDAVFMPVGGSQTEMISSALSYNRLMPDRIKRIGTGLWDDKRIAAQQNMQGAWYAAPSTNSRQSFENRYKETFGGNPLRLATLSYDATALVANLAHVGFSKTGKPDFSYDALTDPNGFSGVDGVFRLQKNGIIQRNLAVLELKNGAMVELESPAPRFYD